MTIDAIVWISIDRSHRTAYKTNTGENETSGGEGQRLARDNPDEPSTGHIMSQALPCHVSSSEYQRNDLRHFRDHGLPEIVKYFFLFITPQPFGRAFLPGLPTPARACIWTYHYRSYFN